MKSIEVLTQKFCEKNVFLEYVNWLPIAGQHSNDGYLPEGVPYFAFLDSLFSLYLNFKPLLVVVLCSDLVPIPALRF